LISPVIFSFELELALTLVANSRVIGIEWEEHVLAKTAGDFDCAPNRLLRNHAELAAFLRTIDFVKSCLMWAPANQTTKILKLLAPAHGSAF
jgi:hypothetical protein